jgi:hypothetical protein
MIFTVAHIRTTHKLFKDAWRIRREPPLRAGRRDGPRLGDSSPYPGGIVFRTLKEAEEYIVKYGKKGFGPFVVQANWFTDTYDADDGYRRLSKDVFMFSIRGYDYQKLADLENLLK